MEIIDKKEEEEEIIRNQNINDNNIVEEKQIINNKPIKEAQTRIIKKKIKNRQEKIQKTIKKWRRKQKIIKEEVTLEEVIINQQNDDINNLKDLFVQYYETKLQIRKQFEMIRNLGKNKKISNINYLIEKEIEDVLLDAHDPIVNLMFLLRNNYDYITKLVSLIEDSDGEEKIDSLVELFCNQFYDNILISNPEQEELLILIYKLLEEEIIPMNSVSIDDFLNDNSFIGKFISSFMNKWELKVFLSMLLNPLISSIENSGLDCMDMSLIGINNEITKKGVIGNKDCFDLELLLKKIPKTTIIFNENNILESEQIDNSNVFKQEFVVKGESAIDKTSKNKKYNPNYQNELTFDVIYQKIDNEESDEMKDFYNYLLEQYGGDPDIFTNAGLKIVLNDPYFKNNKSDIMIKYINNFLFIQKK